MGQVGGVGSLRWEDQQKLHSVIEKGRPSSNGIAGGEEQVDGSISGRPASNFTVELASSGRSKCRKCGEKITKVLEKRYPCIFFTLLVSAVGFSSHLLHPHRHGGGL